MSTTDPHAWAATRVVRLAQSSFLIETVDGLVIAIDPSGPSIQWKAADLVLVTHPHHDHFTVEALRPLLRDGTKVVVPASMAASGDDRGLATDALAPGEHRVICGVPVTAVRAYNVVRPFHPRERDWLGYLFTVDGLNVYHAGDTDLIPEMDGVRADLALLPCGGLFTMGPRDAAIAANRVKARVVVPMHYGKVPFTGGAGRQFASLWSGSTLVK